MTRGRPKLEGREAIRRSFGGLSGGRKVAVEIVVEEPEVLGDSAWLAGEFTVTYGEPEDATPPERHFGRSLLIYRKRSDGRWRMHRDMDTPAPDVYMKPPGAP